MMDKVDVLIIGAGATGLMAAHKLSANGKKVIVLEARERLGGRIHTLNHESFFQHAEWGAEFVHGDLPVTLNLLNEAGIAYHAAGGEWVRYSKGEFVENEQLIENWDLLMDKLNQLRTDKSIGDFLLDEFPGDEHKTMRDGVCRFVAGYDSADPRDASAFALRKEWQSEDDGAQHRPNKGYSEMITYLADKCKAAGGYIYLNSVVKQIHWQKDEVKVVTSENKSYSAKQLIIALPLGVLQADENALAAVIFYPPIPEYTTALRQLGFGAIIKFLLEFDTPFWESSAITKLAGKSLRHMGFLLSDENIPTWWTQHPHHSPLLTGWLGGPPARDKMHKIADELLHDALTSLTHIFKIEIEELKAKIIAWNIVNWTTDPFTLGSYSYDTVAAPIAKAILNKAVDDTLFFAGEYLYDGPAIGTVEAALASGAEVAKKLMD